MTTAMEQAAQWLLRLREDSLSEEETNQWLDWCEADPANLVAFEKAQALWRSIPPQLGAAFARPKTKFVMRWKVATLAAGIAAAAILIMSMQREHNLSVATRIEAPPRVNESSVLPDGSHVALSAGSVVALDFSNTHRYLNMQNGTAFFRVRPDRVRPFVVSAGPVNVTAVGTAFNVRRNANRVVVAVQEGLVRIDDQNQKTVQVAAGHRLTYDVKTRETRLEHGDSSTELAWQRGQLVYNGEPLDVVIENVNRYATKKIELADPALAQFRFTGTVFVNSIDTWLGALPRAFPVTVQSSVDRDLIVRTEAEYPH